MNIMIIGSSGMVGQGVLNACLKDSGVERIVLPMRRAAANLSQDARIETLLLPDLMQLSAQDARLRGLDACFFCAGVSSLGMSEADYRKTTLELTTHIAQQMAAVREDMAFVYISGAGADSTEQSRTMWKRVRGETENALLASTLNTTVFRPAFIMAEAGIRSKTPAYAAMYSILRPLMFAVDKVFPLNLLTTSAIGQAMLNTVRFGSPKPVLESKDIVWQAKRTQ